MKKIIVSVIVVIVVVGGLGYWFYQSKTENIATKKITIDPKNCTYIVDGKNVTLKNGYSEEQIFPGSAPEIVTQYFGNEAVADFNGDGIEDTAFLLTQNSGGSGTFYYVVAALGSKDGCKGTNAVLLGDRIAPQTTEFNNGEIIVNYADRKPNEPMTATPSMGVSKYLEVKDGSLVEVIKPSTSCVPNWQCGWGPCIIPPCAPGSSSSACTNGSQSMVAVDSNHCGLPASTAKIACPALARICSSSTSSTGEVVRKAGEKEFNFLIQKINTDSVDGLMYTLYPVAILQGKPTTLHTGDTVGYSCEGKTAILSSINVANQTVIFNETTTNAPHGGCPI
jgi:hypothetical protein